MVINNLGPSLDELVKASSNGAFQLHRVIGCWNSRWSVSSVHMTTVNLARSISLGFRYPDSSIHTPASSFITTSNHKIYGWVFGTPPFFSSISKLSPSYVSIRQREDGSEPEGRPRIAGILHFVPLQSIIAMIGTMAHRARRFTS